jgi:hypothetical protein
MAWLPLVLRYWQAAAIAALLGFGAFEWHEHNVALIDKGKAEERARVADSALKVLGPLMAHADTVFRHDTVTLTRRITETTTIRDTLLKHLTDTIRVKEFIAASDSAIHACTEAVSSCAVKLRLKDQEIAALNSKLAIAPALVDQRHWYSDRLAVGPCIGVSFTGKGLAGVCGQISLFRYP